MTQKIKRNLSTPEAQKFWEFVDKTAEEVKTWPAWKRAGINVTQMKENPMSDENKSPTPSIATKRS